MSEVDKHLSLKPKDLYTMSDDFPKVSAWFYEQSSGFYIVVCVETVNDINRFIHIEISWRTILASVGRYLKSKGKKIAKEATP